VAIGIFTVVLVVCFVALLQNTIARSPVVFMKLAENNVGEYDLVLSPRLGLDDEDGEGDEEASKKFKSRSAALSTRNETALDNLDLLPNLQVGLNYTEISRKLEPVDTVRGCAPRWTLFSSIANAAEPSRNGSAVVLIMDSAKEQEIGLGRDWDRRPLGQQEVYVSSALLRHIGVQGAMGERVLVGLSPTQLAMLAGIFTRDRVSVVFGQIVISAVHSQNFTIPLDVGKILSEQLGISVPSRQMNVTIVGQDIPDEAIQTFVDQWVDSFFPEIVEAFDEDGISFEATVVDGVDDPLGKWPSSLGNVIVMEMKWIPKLIETLLPQNRALQRLFLEALGLSVDDLHEVENVQIQDHALMVLVQYADRASTYLLEKKAMRKKMIYFSDQVSLALGVSYPATFKMPLVKMLDGLSYFRMFLDQIFIGTLVIMLGLSIMLIYSLLLSDVEEKTYEYGMLRALGLPHSSLFLVLIPLSFVYSIPGILIGLLLGWLLSIPIQDALAYYASLPVNLALDGSAIGMAVIIGLIMPLVSNIFPIQRALSKTLRDALDVYHASTNETSVTFVKLENLGIELWQTALAVMMVVCGFVIYYLIPAAFVMGNMPMFLGILTAILLGMVLGCSLIATSVQPILEKLYLKLFLWGSDRNMEDLIRKALSGHRTRNRKTAIMFTTALAFIIFAGVMFTLQASSFAQNSQVLIGADLLVFSVSWSQPLQEDQMRAYLDAEMARKDSRVVDYSFASFPISASPDMSYTSIGNLASFPSHTVFVVGVDKTYLRSCFSNFYLPVEVNPQFSYHDVLSTNKPDVVRSLYDDAGNSTLLGLEDDGIVIPPDTTSVKTRSYALAQEDLRGGSNNAGILLSAEEVYVDYFDVIVTEAMRPEMSATVNTPMRLRSRTTSFDSSYAQFTYLAKIRAMLKKLPGFLFSSYGQAAAYSSVLVTMDSFQRLLERAYEVKMLDRISKGLNVTDTLSAKPPLARLFVNLKDDVSQLDIEEISNGLRTFIQDERTVLVDTNQVLAGAELASSIILMFFNVISVIAIVLCFFLLWLSFTANVRENAWEFGVLRAVGLSSAQVIRMYVFEALSLIFAAVTLGTAIGIVIAITLTLQFNLFTEMPFAFDFPFVLFFTVVSMAIMVAFGGSYMAARDLRKKQIAQALKGN